MDVSPEDVYVPSTAEKDSQVVDETPIDLKNKREEYIKKNGNHKNINEIENENQTKNGSGNGNRNENEIKNENEKKNLYCYICNRWLL